MLPDAVAEPLRDRLADRRHARELRRFHERPVIPPPHAYKVAAVIECGERFGARVLIETGTYEGEMARRCRRSFREIVTIELDPALAAQARRRLARWPTIRVLEGDSASLLPEVLRELHVPAVFWLDGHYSGAGTARGATDTPLLQELDAITAHPVRGHVILIDDARELGQGDYPELAAIESRVRRWDPSYGVAVADDIVRCLPASPGRNADATLR